MATLSDGSYEFTDGMNSQSDPTGLLPSQYRASMNTLNKGGIVSTRPGYQTLFQLPKGPIQALKLFTPTNAPTHLVVAVAGKIYASASPFATYHQIPNIQFRAGARRIYFATAERSAARSNDRIVLTKPHSVLVMQDGYGRPAFWDGAQARHLDPGAGETPVGTCMAWSGDRLWVARGTELFAGDIADPLSFTETAYLAEGLSFRLPGDITALAEVPATAESQLLVFTQETTSAFFSTNRDRTAWKDTPGFQRVLFPHLGCVSDRSVAQQYGLVWWYSQNGLVALDSAFSSTQSSKLLYLDNEMAVSKNNLTTALERVSIVAHKNYLLVSVPSGDSQNRHTWVLDQSVADHLRGGSPAAWVSYWTGTRPVEWASGVVDGKMRAFQVSRDYDHEGRVWEAFTDTYTDNGTPITCFLETRTYLYGDMNLATFRYADLYVSNTLGSVDLSVSVAGIRGDFTKLGEFRTEAARGGGNLRLGGRSQTRTLRTAQAHPPPATPQPESTLPVMVDRGHALLLVWSGQMAVQGVRLYADPYLEKTTGSPSRDELATAPITPGREVFQSLATESAVDSFLLGVQVQVNKGLLFLLQEDQPGFAPNDVGRTFVFSNGKSTVVESVVSPTHVTVSDTNLTGLYVLDRAETSATRTAEARSHISQRAADRKAKEAAQTLARVAARSGLQAHDPYQFDGVFADFARPRPNEIIYLP